MQKYLPSEYSLCGEAEADREMVELTGSLIQKTLLLGLNIAEGLAYNAELAESLNPPTQESKIRNQINSV